MSSPYEVRARILSMSFAASRTLFGFAREKMRLPSIMAHMKQLKIMPNGGAESRDEIKAGDQKNTNRYIDPSNSVVVNPRAMIRLSLRISRKLVLDSSCSVDVLP